MLRCNSTLSLWNTLLKISILLHNMASDWFHLLLTVCTYCKTLIRRLLSTTYEATNSQIFVKYLQFTVAYYLWKFGKKFLIYHWYFLKYLFYRSNANSNKNFTVDEIDLSTYHFLEPQWQRLFDLLKFWFFLVIWKPFCWKNLLLHEPRQLNMSCNKTIRVKNI